jgi:hypothetical protein
VATKKLFKKKEKMDKCPRIEKRGAKATRLKKNERRKDKIAHVLLQKFLCFKKRGMFSRSIVELGLATIFISHTYSTHMNILI